MEYEMKQSEITEQYRIILGELWRNRDLETILYIRLLMETGFRPKEVYAIRPEHIIHKKVCLPLQYQKCYSDVKEFVKCPEISHRTRMIAEIISQKQGRYFTKSQRYYLRKIKRYRTDKRFSVFELRNLRKKIQWWIYMERNASVC